MRYLFAPFPVVRASRSSSASCSREKCGKIAPVPRLQLLEHDLIIHPFLIFILKCPTIKILVLFIHSWFGMDSNLFRKPDSFMEENNVDDAKEGESEDSEVIAEVARQRDQIRLLQNAVEDQSRILREILHQLKKAEAE